MRAMRLLVSLLLAAVWTAEARPAASLGSALQGFEAVPARPGEPERYLARGLRPGWLVGADLMSLGGISLRLEGANAAARAEAREPLPGSINRFIGNDPSKWVSGARRCGRVTYRNVLPGVSLEYYRARGFVEFDLIVESGTPAGSAVFTIEGAGSMALDPGGDLHLASGVNRVTIRRPILYEESGGSRRPLEGKFVLEGNRLHVRTAGRTPGARLIVDPVLVHSTLIGGTAEERTYSSTADSSGNIYVVGSTTSVDFPSTAGAWDTTFGVGFDAFVAKLAPDGATLVWATFLGGSASDTARGVALDGNGDVYVTGVTILPSGVNDFPTTPGAFDTTAALDDGFVSKIHSGGGSLIYSTFLGGSAIDQGAAISVTGSGEAIVAGITTSNDFPATAGAFQPARAGGAGIYDGWIARLNQAGSSLVYASYLGGGADDQATAVLLDNAVPGTAFVTGFTNSTNFPTTPGVFQGSKGAFSSNAFVTKVDTNASGAASLVWSTYLGGGAGTLSAGDIGWDLALDSAGIVVAGLAGSADFPTTPGAFDRLSGGNDAFVTKLSPAGDSLVFSTFLGGPSGIDGAQGVALDSQGLVTVVGYSGANDFPVTADALTTAPRVGTTDAFVTRLSADGAAILSSTYLGGTGYEYAYKVHVVATDEVAVVGWVQGSTDFPTTPRAFDRTLGGFGDAFVTRLRFTPLPPPLDPDLSLAKTANPDPATQGQPLVYSLFVVNNGGAGATGVSVSDPLPAGVTYASGDPGCSMASNTVTCSFGSIASGGGSALKSFTVTPLNPGSVTNTAVVSANETDANPADNTSVAVTPVAGVAHDLSATGAGPGVTCGPPGAAGGKKQVCTIALDPSFLHNGAVYFEGALDVTSTCKKPGTAAVSCKLKGTLDVVTFNLAGAPAHDVTAFLSADALVGPGDLIVASAPTTLLAVLAPKGKPVKIKYTVAKGQSVSGLHLLLVVDAAGAVAETDETNNVIAIGPLP